MLVTLHYYSESNVLNPLRKLNVHQNKYVSNVLVPNTSSDASAIATAGKLIKYVTNCV